MPFKLLTNPEAELDFPVRWRRGVFLDVDPEYRKAVKKLGGIEVSREEAAEVIEEKPAKHEPEAKTTKRKAEPTD